MSSDLTRALGANLRQVRRSQRLSLAQLAKLSGVSRAMLSQIELGKSTPTVNVLWRITRALDIPFGALLDEPEGSRAVVLRAQASQRVASPGGSIVSTIVFPHESRADFELAEVRLDPGAVECPSPSGVGGRAHLVVMDGTVAVTVAAERHVLQTGDALLFDRDRPHRFANESSEPARVVVAAGGARTAEGGRRPPRSG